MVNGYKNLWISVQIYVFGPIVHFRNGLVTVFNRTKVKLFFPSFENPFYCQIWILQNIFEVFRLFHLWPCIKENELISVTSYYLCGCLRINGSSCSCCSSDSVCASQFLNIWFGEVDLRWLRPVRNIKNVSIRLTELMGNENPVFVFPASPPAWNGELVVESITAKFQELNARCLFPSTALLHVSTWIQSSPLRVEQKAEEPSDKFKPL